MDHAESERRNVKAAGLFRLGHLLQKRLRVLCCQQLIEIVLQCPPLRHKSDSQHESEPNRRDEGALPHWSLKPRKTPSTACEIAALAQRVDESRVLKDGKLLPKQNVDEKTAEHPNLHDEQCHGDQDQQH